MERIPSWEANSRSAVQEISSLLWNLKLYYRIRIIRLLLFGQFLVECETRQGGREI
jgi:hypothetical protein